MRDGEPRPDRRGEEVARVADVEDEEHPEDVGRELRRACPFAQVVLPEERAEDDGVEVVEGVADGQDLEERGAHEGLEEPCRVGAQEEEPVGGHEKRVAVDGARAEDEGAEIVEDEEEREDRAEVGDARQERAAGRLSARAPPRRRTGGGTRPPPAPLRRAPGPGRPLRRRRRAAGPRPRWSTGRRGRSARRVVARGTYNQRMHAIAMAGPAPSARPGRTGSGDGGRRRRPRHRHQSRHRRVRQEGRRGGRGRRGARRRPADQHPRGPARLDPGDHEDDSRLRGPGHRLRPPARLPGGVRRLHHPDGLRRGGDGPGNEHGSGLTRSGAAERSCRRRSARR